MTEERIVQFKSTRMPCLCRPPLVTERYGDTITTKLKEDGDCLWCGEPWIEHECHKNKTHMSEDNKPQLFRNDAKSIVDTMFESGILRPDITRDEMNSLEAFIQYAMESRYESVKKMDAIMKNIDSRK